MPEIDFTFPVGDPLLGKTIDNYQIVEVVGRGGMGVVYKARDITLDRDVAIKMMDTKLLAGERHRRRFEVEARALAKLKHQNIVDVYALRQTEFGLMIVMEFVGGQSLQSFIKEKAPVPIDTAIEIFTQMLNGLYHAHQMGIVHRDVKPANVLFSVNGELKITDFGLAKLKDVVALTQTGSTMGSPPYMSPEQVRGEEVDHRSDIWSAGVLLYQMLAGKTPFSSTEILGLYYQITNASPQPVGQIRPDAAGWLDTLVSRCMAKDKDSRPKDCAEILNEISTRLNKPVVKYEQTRTATGTLHKRSRGRTLALSAAAIVAVVALAFLLSPVLFPRPKLTVRTDPPGAAVVIGKDTVGATPLYDLEVPAGSFPLTLCLQGYVPIETTLTASSGTGLDLAFSLQKYAGTMTGAEEAGRVSSGAGADTRDRYEAGAARFESPHAFAAYVADVLRQTPGTASGQMTILPFPLEDTGISDGYSLFLKNILEARFSVEGRWTVLDTRDLQSLTETRERSPYEAPTPGFYVRGAYWPYDDSVRVMASAVRNRDRAILTAVEAIFPGRDIRRMQLRPKDLARVLEEKALYSAAQPTQSKPSSSGHVEAAPPPSTSPRPAVTSSGGAQEKLSVDVWTNRGKEGLIFVEGETMEVHVKANRPCYIRVVYHLADGRRILPAEAQSHRLEARGATPLEWVENFECSAPFGAEYLHVFAKTTDFEPVLYTVDAETGYWVLSGETKDLVSMTRGIRRPPKGKESQAEASLMFTTLSKEMLPKPEEIVRESDVR